MRDPLRRLIDALEARGCGPTQSGDQWSARCPAHDDTRPSLSLTEGDDGRVLARCHANCTLNEVAEALGLEVRDFFPPGPGGGTQIAATYPYRDEAGQPLYEVVRTEPKGFFQRRPNGNGGWINDAKSVRRVIYRLPEIIKALRENQDQEVFIVEGEKDVDRLRQLGLIATTNVGGAGKGKWNPEYTKQLQDAGAQRVIVIPDNDKPGVAHAEAVARSCADAGLETRIIQLPGLPSVREKHGEDVSDWLDDGHTVDALRASVLNASVLRVSDLDADASDREGLPLVSLASLLRAPEESQPWLVDSILPASGISVLAGKPKAGKSTLARCLALAIARGDDWLGRKVEQGPVIYLALEEKQNGVRGHFLQMGANEADPIHFLFLPVEDGFEKLTADVERLRPALVIVDTMIRFTSIRDINDYAVVARELQPFMYLARKTRAHISFLHHLGKGERSGGDSILGSTAILGTVDTALLLRRTDDYRTIRSIQRCGEDLEETVVRLDAEIGQILLAGTREEADTERLSVELVEALREEREPVREEPALGLVEGKKQTKGKALRRLVDAGVVTRTGAGKKGDPYLYSVSRILPPPMSGEGENQNSAGSVTPSPDDTYSTSHESTQDAVSGEPREGESDRPGLGDAQLVVDAEDNSRILPPTTIREGENQNPRGSGNDTGNGTYAPSHEIAAEGSGSNGREGESLVLPFTDQPLSTCPVCGRTRLWKDFYGSTHCGVCHPPAPEAVSEWIGPQ